MNYILHYIFYALLLVCITTNVYSQVRIGSKQTPVAGALLELSNATEDEAISTKGLGLPRVQLISPTELYPMFSKTDDSYNTDQKRKEQKEKHIGLLVYVPEVFSDNFCPGLYVWDGKRWAPFLEPESKNQQTFTDGEGNTYHYAQFGDKYWTTDNIMTTRVGGEASGVLLSKSDQNKSVYPLGINIADHFTNGIPLLIETRQDIIDYGLTTYKMNDDVLKVSMIDFTSKFGILYTYYQALQACPTGWRLPSKTDFDEMYQSIQNRYGISPQEAATSMRNDRSAYETINDGQKEIWAGVNLCDKNAINSGFKAVPSGAIHGNPSGTAGILATDFGAFSFWWFEQNGVPSTSLQRYSIGRQSTILTLESSAGGSIYPYPYMQYSVRCIKNAN